jgi:hypothetical protein
MLVSRGQECSGFILVKARGTALKTTERRRAGPVAIVSTAVERVLRGAWVGVSPPGVAPPTEPPDKIGGSLFSVSGRDGG